MQQGSKRACIVNLDIRVARNGKELGVFNEKTLAAAIADGTVNRDDWAWYEGLDAWQPVSAFIPPSAPPPIPKRKPKVKKQKPPPKDEYAATRHYN